MKIGLVYFSSGDITEKLVDSAVGAIEQQGVKTYKHRILGNEIVEGRFTNQQVLDDLADCRAIILGSPTYMGGIAAQLKAFIDATSTLWCDQAWSGKIAAGITCGGALNGDQSSTLQYMATFASQQGMIWVGLDAAHGFNDHGVNRLGCQWGVVAQSTSDVADERDLLTAAYLGKRIAQLIGQ